MAKSGRRKRGLFIGLGLMSAAALVAFGTSRVAARRVRSAEDGETDAAGEGGSVPSLWERGREMLQAAYLLVTQRRPDDS